MRRVAYKETRKYISMCGAIEVASSAVVFNILVTLSCIFTSNTVFKAESQNKS